MHHDPSTHHSGSHLRKTKNEYVDFVRKQGARRQSNKVLHGHPSPMFWDPADIPSAEVLRAAPSPPTTKGTNLYIATPYCLPTDPDRCGFCLFPSEIYEGHGQLARYLTYLRKEGEMYRDRFAAATVSSIYFGGGTSNLYKPAQYATLLDIVREFFRVPDGIEITLEGIPQLFTREKLLAMKDAGMNRVSIGAQQLDPEMIKLSGRKQTAAHVYNSIEWCQELGLEASVDLIFGWPTQTPEKMLEDLGAIVGTGIRHITHYELNVAGRSDFAVNHRETLPSIAQNVEMYRISKEFLTSHGYTQGTVYDWEKRDPDTSSNGAGRYLYEENLRRTLYFDEQGDLQGHDMLGWGFAGVTIFTALDAPAASFMNPTSVDRYFQMLDAGQMPIERGFSLSRLDVQLLYLFQALQTMYIDGTSYGQVFRSSLVEGFRPLWDALEELGWARVEGASVRVVGDGELGVPVIQAAISHERVEEIRTSRRGRESRELPPLVQLRPRALGGDRV
jgi:oxygen-independent coproporphyrinogen-3 oxidase